MKTTRLTFFITLIVTFIVSFLFSFLFVGKKIEQNSLDVIPLSSTLEAKEQNNFNFDYIDVASPNSKLTEDEKNNIAIYNRCNASVVNITTEVLAYNFFLEAVPQEGGSGSGAIIDEKGIILTNTHVVSKAHKVFVNLSDGSQYEGKVIGKDLENDLAVVQINPDGKKLVAIPFGESKSLQIGQKVLAIGNPFGYDRTLTTGIISGLARPVKTANNLIIQNMIQTDASINPGNSGGPLINSSGEMVGINTMIYSPTGGSVGIGFAVPIDTAKRVVGELINYGEVKRGWLDLTPVQLTNSIVRYCQLPVSKGLLVSKVASGGLSSSAGIQGGTQAVRYGSSVIYLGGDIIVEVDGQEVSSFVDLLSALEDNKPGEVVVVKAYRGEKLLSFNVKLSPRPSNLL